MTRSRPILLAGILFMALLAMGLLIPFDSWPDILWRPWQLLWGTHQQLNATLLEASGGAHARTLGEPLLKPLGAVKLLREVETDPKSKS